jgi:hypothetical protein
MLTWKEGPPAGWPPRCSAPLAGGWLGEGLARWRLLRFQPLPVEPCMRFSRTRLTDVLHRRCSTGARQGRFGLGAMTVPLREISPRLSGER